MRACHVFFLLNEDEEKKGWDEGKFARLSWSMTVDGIGCGSLLLLVNACSLSVRVSQVCKVDIWMEG